MHKVALIGSPNAGKTTFFNKLTNNSQTIANRPGATVEAASGLWEDCILIDLPGCHSISQTDVSLPYDEQVTAAYIAQNKIDYIVNLVDITRLESSLYLTTQLLETGIPIIVVISKKDLAKKLGINIDTKLLSKGLKAPAIALDITNNDDIRNLTHSLKKHLGQQPEKPKDLITQCNIIKKATKQITKHIKSDLHLNKESIALNMLASNSILKHNCQKLQQAITKATSDINEHYEIDTDIVIAQNRYNFIKKITSIAVTLTIKPKIKASKIDHIITHQIFGIPILLAAIITMFWFTMAFGGMLQECFTLIGEAIFIQGTAALLQLMHAPSWIFIFLINGLGYGITTLIAFVPIVAAIFYSMELLEQSGYMSRAAFITDKIMRYLQLPGKAFIPLIISFGCNVPGILATRTLTSQRERLITGLMTPFMSCNARLAVFAVFSSIFFPQNSLKVIISLYFIGILVAIVTGIVMARFILPGESEKLIMEMPAYQMPKQKELLLSTCKKTKSFCIRVGKYIFISSAIIGVFSQTSISDMNIIEIIGKTLTPLFAAIGITTSNWQATVALLSGFIAKETTLITLDQLYSHTSALNYITPGEFLPYLGTVLQDAASVIYQTLWPWASQADSSNIILHTQIKQHFTSEAAAWSYLLFNLLYMPCISTIITFAKECGWKWAWLSTSWSFTIAYILAGLSYQLSSSDSNLIITAAFIIASILLNLILAKAIVKHTSPEPKTP